MKIMIVYWNLYAIVFFSFICHWNDIHTYNIPNNSIWREAHCSQFQHISINSKEWGFSKYLFNITLIILNYDITALFNTPNKNKHFVRSFTFCPFKSLRCVKNSFPSNAVHSALITSRIFQWHPFEKVTRI